MQPRNPKNSILLDTSRWNGNPDYNQIAAYTFPDSRKTEGVIIRATMGHTYVDTKLDYNLKGAKSVGLKVGLYHVLCAKTEAEAEVEAGFFLSVLEQLGGISAVDIVPCLDVETINGDPAELPNVARRWKEVVEAHTRYCPMIYSYPNFINNYLHGLTDIPLWLAHYDTGTPGDYGGWNEWQMLQYTSQGHVPGILSNVDISEWNGVLDVYRMSKEDADKMIAICSTNWALAVHPEEKDEWHRMANELRLASGQTVQN